MCGTFFGLLGCGNLLDRGVELDLGCCFLVFGPGPKGNERGVVWPIAPKSMSLLGHPEPEAFFSLRVCSKDRHWLSLPEVPADLNRTIGIEGGIAECIRAADPQNARGPNVIGYCESDRRRVDGRGVDLDTVSAIDRDCSGCLVGAVDAQSAPTVYA